ELRFDSSALSPFLSIDSAREAWVPPLHAPAGALWARVRLHDRGGKETPWSESRKLAWQGAATGVRDSDVPADLTLSAASASSRSFFVLRFGLPVAGPIRIQILDAQGR